MSVKNILVAYSGESERSPALRHAINIAKYHQGFLSGIVRHGMPPLQKSFTGQIPQQVLDQIDKADAERIREIGKLFHTIVGKAGLSKQSEFFDLEANQGHSLSVFARHFDLIVTGASSKTGEEHLAADPEALTLYSGRPVLVVPKDYESKTVADHAIVAWDGKRCAARALGDAMDVLEDKGKVTLLEVGKEQVPGTDVLLRNLERHGIDAQLINRPRHGSVANTVLETTEEVGAKLIVMGAFEHSRFQQSLIGGVTTDVMARSTVPVFLSH
ncbi:universal stress protein [Shimia sp.]|uniref:universal stress protein n=1 Tax=Shimia sp. TaxID=1954381 RepID=UPI00329863E3